MLVESKDPSEQDAPQGLAGVLALHADAYCRAHKLPAQHRKVLFAVQACRTKLLGGHLNECNSCGSIKIFYNSCRNRHCPKCQYLNKERWVDKLSARLLPVKYFHIVFTIPSELNALCLVNQKVLYDILFKAASDTILTLGRDKKHLGAETGLLAVLHTWGQNLLDHPHLHTVVPAGGWSEENGYWKRTKRNYFVNAFVMGELFRGKFLSLLSQVFKQGQLKFEGQIASLRYWSAFNNMLSELYKKKWVVYAKAPFKSSGAIIKYLGRYTHRVAITDQRIISFGTNEVKFTWKDYRTGGNRKSMTLKPDEFIRRYLLHVLPNGYRRIRYFGILNGRARHNMEACRNAMSIKKELPKLEGLKWNEQLVFLGHRDPQICSKCKNACMEIRYSFKHKRGPPTTAHA